MFKFGPTVKSPLDKAIENVFREMENHHSGSDEYAKMTAQLTELHALKEKSNKRVSPDTLAVVAGNLAGILVIVGHERTHVVTSKALQFILKAAR